MRDHILETTIVTVVAISLTYTAVLTVLLAAHDWFVLGAGIYSDLKGKSS